ncbi:hypoxanthine phosphoribosyltransferase [Vibrio tritonius]|uniref:Hypoxanthine phosphoribosyltransferase n=1 Tax=Vibrio tritonius TaxID=1435069 RepID=A0ABS7YRA9_9VIBR|nr:phosphoribosyltransferase family protein [Vibrio tritonius]MCA2018225.1 hypoxanthine phosphoribosyltransferase [Vibrio tritonius]
MTVFEEIGASILDEVAIAKGVEHVAQLLNALYEDAVVITVVPGGILFTADLVRQLKFPIKMDYVSCPHTPGERNNQSEIVFHNNISIRDRHVILVDDAIESGGTMKRILAYLQQQFAPKSIAVATLFVKPGRVSLAAQQYYGYEMSNDDLLIGYGLPWNDYHRNLPYIAKLNTTSNEEV